MKKNILITLIAVFGFAFASNAQTCCSSKSKDASCAKKTTTAVKATATKTATAVLASNPIATEKTEEFTVYGNCGMCEKAIENTLLHLTKGVSKADWNKKTDQLTVTFDEAVIKLDDIKQKLADIGYDTETHRAKDSVYNQLPMCCQYDRPEKL